jgi:hypothetical protein
MAITSEPPDHWAIISENPLPIPLVTMALFMMPMATSRIPVMIDDFMPISSASLIFDGPICTGSKASESNQARGMDVNHETTTSAAIAQEAA